VSTQVVSIVVMGVSGSGKSTVGEKLANDIHAEYLDGDWVHPRTNVEKMARGVPLDDNDREPWLQAIAEHAQRVRSEGRSIVVACSALKRSYRTSLRDRLPDLFFVFLDGTFEEIASRMQARTHEFMAASMLTSQFATLEPLESDEYGQRIDCTLSPDEISLLIRARLIRPTIEEPSDTSEVGP
jgi:gluconokinase